VRRARGVEQLDDAQLEYAEHDVLHLHELLFRMEELIRLDRLQKAWGLEQRLAPVVVDMTNRGVPFDREGAIAAYQTVKPRLEAPRKRYATGSGSPVLISIPRPSARGTSENSSHRNGTWWKRSH
jgi:hypothetical protein